MIISLILITFSLDFVLISSGENWRWSLLGLKGLNESITMYDLDVAYHMVVLRLPLLLRIVI